MSEPTATTDELEFESRRYIEDREYRARYDAQEWRKRSPQSRAFHEGLQRRNDELEKWIEAGMRQERREETARRLGFFPTRRRGPAQVISIATRRPV
jgi:hypothetical protein